MFKILLTLIFIRPFISSLAFPYADFIYSICLATAMLIWIMRNGIPFKEIKPIKYALLLFLLSLLISVTFSQNRTTSIKALYNYIIALMLFITAISLNHGNKSRIISVIITGAFVISFLAIYQYFFGFQNLLNYVDKQHISSPFTLEYIHRRRVFQPFVTPNILGGYLAMIIPLALSKKNKVWFIVPLFLALLLTKSIGAFLSLFLALVMYFYLQGKLEKRSIFFLAALSAIIILIFILRVVTEKEHLTPLFSTTMRLNYWKDTLRIIKMYPLTGIGLGNFNLAQARYAHNSYLQIAAEIGILGIISICWLIIVVFKGAIKKLRSSSAKNQIIGLMASCMAFLIHNFLDFSFFLTEVSFIWWIILGLALERNEAI